MEGDKAFSLKTMDMREKKTDGSALIDCHVFINLQYKMQVISNRSIACMVLNNPVSSATES